MRRARASTLAVAALACGSSAQAASFDCGAAASAMERLVCSDTALDARDAILAKVHAAARLNDADGRIARSQREWLTRAQACRTTGCLADAYDRRIAELLRSSNGNAAAAHFYTQTPAGLHGTLDVIGPVHGFAAVALSATFVGPGGVDAGDVNAASRDAVLDLREGSARTTENGCTLTFKPLGANRWTIAQSGTCDLPQGTAFAGLYEP